MNKKARIAVSVVLFLVVAYLGLSFYATDAARARIDASIKKWPPNTFVYKDVSHNLFSGQTVIAGVSILPPGGVTTTRIDRIVIRRLSDDAPNPTSLAVDIQGMTIDPAALGSADAARFTALGYTGPLSCDLGIDYEYAKDKRELALNAVTLSIKDVCALRLSLTLGNLDFDPNQAAKLLFTYPSILLARAELVYTDASLMDRVLKQEAAKKGVDVATLKKTMIDDADAALLKGKNPPSAEITAALKQFIENPRQLSISLTPARPVPLGDIGRAGSPEAVAKLLNLQVKS